MSIHHFPMDPACLHHTRGSYIPEGYFLHGMYTGPTCAHCRVHHMKTRRYRRTAPRKNSRGSNAFVSGFFGQIGRSLARMIGFR